MDSSHIDISDIVREEARQWQVRLYSGAATHADAQAFKRWIARNPTHGQAWRELTAKMRVMTPVMQAAEHLREDWKEHAAASRSRRQKNRRAFMGGAVTAAAVGVLAWRPPLGLWPAVTEFTADFRTGVGEQREIQLGQAVAVQMNTQTRINRRASDQGLGMTLLAGEAEIRVGDAALTVQAGPGQVLAQAVQFNMRYTGPQVAVTCLHGHLRVEAARTLDLQAGQQAFYDLRQAYEVKDVDLVQVSAWRNGHLIFAGTPLDEVVAEINRYRPGKIFVYSDALKRRAIHLNLAINDIDLVLDVLGSLSGIKVQELAGGVTLLVQA